MKTIVLSAFFLLMELVANSQTIKCNELFNYVIENGYKKATLSSYQLSSSWLYKVTAYSYNYKIYVVAEIKENEYSLKTSPYIFCNIPSLNWTYFQIGNGESDSYGERFHKYIRKYTCDCN